MNKLKFILPGTVFVFILCNITLMQESCSYNEIEEPKKEVFTYCDSVTYSGKVKAIIAAECAVPGCHESGFSNGDFTSYTTLQPYLDNGKFNSKVFVTGSMPPGGFSKAATKDTLKCWYDKGHLNN